MAIRLLDDSENPPSYYMKVSLLIRPHEHPKVEMETDNAKMQAAIELTDKSVLADALFDALCEVMSRYDLGVAKKKIEIPKSVKNPENN